jgi:putative heme-binding domain-containing protein
MSVLGKEELLVHILDPSRDVEGNYHAYSVVLTDGRVLNGMLAGESATSIELIDGEAKRRQILREDIEELSRSSKSVMPDGFEKLVSRGELSDLLEFLTERTQFVPLDLGRVATTSNTEDMFQATDSQSSQAYEQVSTSGWGLKPYAGVPFYRINPQDGRVRNVVMLRAGRRDEASSLPRSVELQCRMAAKAIHILTGSSEAGPRADGRRASSLLVRLHYADGSTEEHRIGGRDLPPDRGSDVERNETVESPPRDPQPLHYSKIEPGNDTVIRAVEFAAGFGASPAIVAVTAEQ